MGNTSGLPELVLTKAATAGLDPDERRAYHLIAV